MVKGAFDLYRHALLKKLGYDASPQTRQAERNLWEAISHQIIFGDTRRVRVPPLVEPATCVEVNPDWLSMTIHRSVDPPDATGRQRVYLRVTNSDASQRPAKSVVLVERLPTNAELVHDSMTPPVWVEGINPVRILLGPMGAKETASIRFDIVRHKD